MAVAAPGITRTVGRERKRRVTSRFLLMSNWPNRVTWPHIAAKDTEASAVGIYSVYRKGRQGRRAGHGVRPANMPACFAGTLLMVCRSHSKP